MADPRATQQVGLAVVAGFVAGVVGGRLAAPAPPAPPRDDALRAQVEALSARLADVPSQERLSELEAVLERLSAGPDSQPPAEPDHDPDGELTAQLRAAIDAGPDGPALVARYEALLAEGLDPDRPAADGLPPLVVASGLGRAALVARLLDHADPNQRGEGWGQTALLAAASAGHAEIVEALLAKGGDPTAVCGPRPEDPPYVTALSQARATGDEALSARLQDIVGHWPGRRRIAAVVGYLAAAPGPQLAEAPITVELGRPGGRWGRYELTVGADPVVDETPFPLPALLGEQLFEIEVRWRQGQQAGQQRLFLNKPNANEPVVAGVLELGRYPTNVRIEVVIDPITTY